MGLDQTPDRLDRFGYSAVLLGGKQPEVPLMELYFVYARNGPQHRDVTIFLDARPYDGLVAVGADPVQDGALYRDLLVQDPAALEERGDGAG